MTGLQCREHVERKHTRNFAVVKVEPGREVSNAVGNEHALASTKLPEVNDVKVPARICHGAGQPEPHEEITRQYRQM